MGERLSRQTGVPGGANKGEGALRAASRRWAGPLRSCCQPDPPVWPQAPPLTPPAGPPAQVSWASQPHSLPPRMPEGAVSEQTGLASGTEPHTWTYSQADCTSAGEGLGLGRALGPRGPLPPSTGAPPRKAPTPRGCPQARFCPAV